MKSILLIPILASALLSAIIETKEGTFLQIYAKKNPQSNIIATVSTSKGKIVKKRCFNTKGEIEWCKIAYTDKGVNINGFSDKKSLDTLATTLNTKATFEKSYGGRYNEVGNAILPLEDGILIVGSTESIGYGQKDAYILKLDNFGNKIYEAAYGGGGIDIAKAVVPVSDGFMIAGTTRSFGNTVQSIYLAKIAKDGNLKWQNGYYSDGDDYYTGNAIAKISDTKLLVAGFEDHVTFFNSRVNGYLNAIDTDGKRSALRYYGGEDVEKINSIVSANGGYVFAGETDTWGHGGKDAYVVKINKEGNIVWEKAFGFGYDELAKQVIATQDGGFIVVGSTDSYHHNQKEVYVVKMDKDGNREWHNHFGSNEQEEGSGIVEVADGYVIVGYTKNTPNYNSDVYLLKINKNGYVVWSKNYGGEKDDKGHAIAKVKDGFVITGYSTSPQNYSKDLYILKVDNEGNIN